MKVYSIRLIVRAISFLLFILLFIEMGWGIRGVILAFLVTEILIFSIMVFFTRGLFLFVIHDFIGTTKKFILFGGQIFLTSAIWTLIMYSDMLIVGYFLPAKEVGIYAIASLVAKTGFLTLPSSISTVTFPMISSMNQKNLRDSIQKLMNSSIKFTLIILSIGGFFIIFFIEPVIKFFLGPEFLPAIAPLLVLLVGATFFGAIASVGGATAAMNRPDIAYKLNLLIGIIFIMSDLVLIPRYGLIGAALGTTIAFVLFPVLSFFFMKKIFDITLDMFPFISVFLGISCFIAIFYVFREYPFYYLLIGGYFILYILFLFFKLLTTEDKLLLQQAKQRFLSFLP